MLVTVKRRKIYTSLGIRSMSKGSWREFDDSSTPKPNRSQFIPEKSERNVRVQKTRGGKSGKTVTVISGLALDAVAAKCLLKILKAKCGTGGTLKGDLLELQGDHIATVLKLLRDEGYCPKKSGG